MAKLIIGMSDNFWNLVTILVDDQNNILEVKEHEAVTGLTGSTKLEKRLKQEIVFNIHTLPSIPKEYKHWSYNWSIFDAENDWLTEGIEQWVRRYVTQEVPKPKTKAAAKELIKALPKDILKQRQKSLEAAENLALYETWGHRREMEDAAVAYELEAEVSELSEQQISDNLQKTYSNLDSQVLKLIEDGEFNDSGSTAFTALIQHKENDLTISSALLADAAGFLVGYDDEGKVVYVERLNSKIHTPSSPEEKERIEKAGATLFRGRIYGNNGSNLGVARAIGDAAFKKVVTSEALIEHKKLSSVLQTEPKITKVQIIISCDGFTEGADKKYETIPDNKERHERYLKDCLDQLKTPGANTELQISEHLAKSAMADNSGDNITVLTQTIYKNRAINCGNLLLGVYDGHGGKGAASFIAENIVAEFEKTYKNQNEAINEFQQAPTIVDDTKKKEEKTSSSQTEKILDIDKPSEDQIGTPVIPQDDKKESLQEKAEILDKGEEKSPIVQDKPKEEIPLVKFVYQDPLDTKEKISKALETYKKEYESSDEKNLLSDITQLETIHNDEKLSFAEKFENISKRIDFWGGRFLKIKTDMLNFYTSQLNKKEELEKQPNTETDLSNQKQDLAKQYLALNPLTTKEKISAALEIYKKLCEFEPAEEKAKVLEEIAKLEAIHNDVSLLNYEKINQLGRITIEAKGGIWNRYFAIKGSIEQLYKNEQKINLQIQKPFKDQQQFFGKRDPLIQTNVMENPLPTTAIVDKGPRKKIKNLLTLCNNYLKHLREEIESEGLTVDQAKLNMAKALYKGDPNFELAIKKHEVVAEFRRILLNHNNNDELKLDLFKNSFRTNKELLGTRRDSAGMIFLKAVATILFIGLPILFGIWSVAGATLTEEIEKLDPLMKPDAQI